MLTETVADYGSCSDNLVLHHVYSDTHRPRGRLNGTSITHNLTYDTPVEVKTLHPAHVFIRILERIRIESVTIHTAPNNAKKRLHSHRRSAQVFLLRLFIELLEDTIHSDPTKSDAIWKPRLETALPEDYESFEQFIHEVYPVLTRKVAEEQAEWQVGIEYVDAHDLKERFEALLKRNLRAFDRVRDWVSSLSFFTFRNDNLRVLIDNS